jgi:hypothetical protein
MRSIPLSDILRFRLSRKPLPTLRKIVFIRYRPLSGIMPSETPSNNVTVLTTLTGTPTISDLARSKTAWPFALRKRKPMLKKLCCQPEIHADGCAGTPIRKLIVRYGLENHVDPLHKGSNCAS